MPKELAVAAVTVLSFFLVGGSGGGGAVLGAAVLILTLLPIVRLVVRPVGLAAVPFAVRITGDDINSTMTQHRPLMLRSGSTRGSGGARTCRRWAGR